MRSALLLVATALGLLTLVLGPRLYWLAVDKDYYGWPAVTKCRICDKTVWVWQSYDRRPIPVQLENEQGLAVSCGMTGLMHVKCKGLPQAVKVTVSVTD